MAFAGQGFLFAVLLTEIPDFKARYGIGDGAVTLVVLGVSLIAGLGSVLAEILAARRSSKLALRVGLLWIALAAVVIGVSGKVALFYAAFGLYGLGLGAVDAGTNMQAVALQTRYGRSILTGFHACWSGGGIAGALFVAGAHRLDRPVSATVLLAALLVLVVGGLAGGWLLAAGHGVTAPVPGVTAEAGRAALRALSWRPVLLLGAAMICFYVTDAGAGSWATTYLHDVLLASDSLAPVAYAGYQAAGLLSRLAGDRAVRRFGATLTVRTGAILGVLGLLVAITADGPVPAIVGFTVAGLGLPVVAPLCFAACGLLAPGHADALVARVNIFNYLGSIVGGVAVGGIGTITSLRWGFVVPAVLAAMLLLLAPAFSPSSPRQSLEDA
ncbi:MAG: transporter [Frankiales bacterium]|nr:transporter [Frankiales bacterium]